MLSRLDASELVGEEVFVRPADPEVRVDRPVIPGVGAQDGPRMLDGECLVELDGVNDLHARAGAAELLAQVVGVKPLVVVQVGRHVGEVVLEKMLRVAQRHGGQHQMGARLYGHLQAHLDLRHDGRHARRHAPTFEIDGFGLAGGP